MDDMNKESESSEGRLTDEQAQKLKAFKQADRPLTFGEKAVGLTFNPSKLPAVDGCKRVYADIIDKLDESRHTVGQGEQGRYLSTAITHAEISCMLAVKALTWQY